MNSVQSNNFECFHWSIQNFCTLHTAEHSSSCSIVECFTLCGVHKFKIIIRDQPFNLKGGVMVFLFHFFFGQHESQNINFFCHAECEIFFLNSILGYMSKTLNQIIFFSSTKIRIFFSGNIGNQNIFLEKNHNPPLQVKGIRYSSKGR